MSILSDLFKKKENNNDYSLDETACELIEYLNCECEYIAPTSDTDALWEKYLENYEQGKNDGFTPVYISVDDALLETLLTSADFGDDEEDDEVEDRNENNDDTNIGDDQTYREKLLSCKLEDGNEYLNRVFSELIENLKEREGQDEITQIYGESYVEEISNKFVGWKDFNENETYELLFAKIPTSKPWEVFAWIPFGGWNECPKPKEMMAAAKYWYDEFGAVPGLITQNTLEMYLPKPINNIDVALKIAEQHYGFCRDIVDEDCSSIKSLADKINKSTVWYFWWD